MALHLQLQNLPEEADNLDIRHFFEGFDIPKGGVQIIGGPTGDAFIAFHTQRELLRALERDGKFLLGQPVRLLLTEREDIAKALTKVSQEMDGDPYSSHSGVYVADHKRQSRRDSTSHRHHIGTYEGDVRRRRRSGSDGGGAKRRRRNDASRHHHSPFSGSGHLLDMHSDISSDEGSIDSTSRRQAVNKQMHHPGSQQHENGRHAGYVQVSNIPITTTARDLREFFRGYEVAEGGIIMKVNDDNPDTLIANIRFVHMKDALNVQSTCKGLKLQGQYIAINLISEQEFSGTPPSLESSSEDQDSVHSSQPTGTGYQYQQKGSLQQVANQQPGTPAHEGYSVPAVPQPQPHVYSNAPQYAPNQYQVPPNPQQYPAYTQPPVAQPYQAHSAQPPYQPTPQHASNPYQYPLPQNLPQQYPLANQAQPPFYPAQSQQPYFRPNQPQPPFFPSQTQLPYNQNQSRLPFQQRQAQQPFNPNQPMAPFQQNQPRLPFQQNQPQPPYQQNRTQAPFNQNSNQPPFHPDPQYRFLHPNQQTHPNQGQPQGSFQPNQQRAPSQQSPFQQNEQRDPNQPYQNERRPFMPSNLSQFDPNYISEHVYTLIHLKGMFTPSQVWQWVGGCNGPSTGVIIVAADGACMACFAFNSEEPRAAAEHTLRGLGYHVNSFGKSRMLVTLAKHAYDQRKLYETTDHGDMEMSPKQRFILSKIVPAPKQKNVTAPKSLDLFDPAIICDFYFLKIIDAVKQYKMATTASKLWKVFGGPSGPCSGVIMVNLGKDQTIAALAYKKLYDRNEVPRVEKFPKYQEDGWWSKCLGINLVRTLAQLCDQNHRMFMSTESGEDLEITPEQKRHLLNIVPRSYQVSSHQGEASLGEGTSHKKSIQKNDDTKEGKEKAETPKDKESRKTEKTDLKKDKHGGHSIPRKNEGDDNKKDRSREKRESGNDKGGTHAKVDSRKDKISHFDSKKNLDKGIGKKTSTGKKIDLKGKGEASLTKKTELVKDDKSSTKKKTEVAKEKMHTVKGKASGGKDDKVSVKKPTVLQKKKDISSDTKPVPVKDKVLDEAKIVVSEDKKDDNGKDKIAGLPIIAKDNLAVDDTQIVSSNKAIAVEDPKKDEVTSGNEKGIVTVVKAIAAEKPNTEVKADVEKDEIIDDVKTVTGKNMQVDEA